MNAEQWRQVKPILESALELNSGSRRDFLDSVCIDTTLRREVDSLLAAHDQAHPGALSPGSALNLDVEEQARFLLLPGKRIGAYEILEEIAQGGMGAVYRAVRADGQYEQQVALKIVRAEPGGELAAARFRNERQILASLDHPNIAKILDGGTTADGLPYFVMEFIEGLTITEYCDRHKLTTDARLKLFQTVCSAVHYAHQHLVIHRDLKPTNIFVTADGVPKLLDFGIAKGLNPNLRQENAILTSRGFWLMTPEYASPEQLRGEVITTATDVYSLGLVLFELLAGQPVCRFRNLMPHEIARVVLEMQPERPSVVAWRRARLADGQKLDRRLARELDNIVMKAIRKEPRERYTSVEQFAEDVRRHLENLPIVARQDSATYRASKFIKRHKAGVASGFALAVAVIAGLAITLHEAQIAQAQRLRAEARFNDVRDLANSLMFDVHDSIQNLPGSTPARKLLVERALRYLDKLARDSASDASLQRDLGTAYEKVGTVQGNPFGANLGDTRGALESYGKALTIRESLARANPRDIDQIIALSRTERLNAAVLFNRADPIAVQKLKQALATAERASQIAPSGPAVMGELQASYYLIAIILDGNGDYQGAVGYLQKQLAIAEKRLRSSPEDRVLRRELGRTEARLGYALAKLGSRIEGMNHSRRGIQMIESLPPDEMDVESSRWLGMAHWIIGDILLMDGNATEALRNYQEQRRIVKALIAADPANAVLQYDLGCASARVGNTLALGGNHASGLNMMNRAAKMFEVQLSRDPAYIEPRFCLAATFVWTGDAFARTGQLNRAIESYQKGLAIWQALAASSKDTGIEADVALIHSRIGSALAELKKSERASEEYHRALAIAAAITSSNPNIVEAKYVLADVYSGLGELSQTLASRNGVPVQQKILRWNEARTWYQLSLDAWQRIQNPGARSPVGFACGNPRMVARQLAILSSL